MAEMFTDEENILRDREQKIHGEGRVFSAVFELI
jgi:hypothetical protein